MVVGCFRGNRYTVGGIHKNVRFVHQIDFEAQSDRQRCAIIRAILVCRNTRNDVRLHPISLGGHLQVNGCRCLQQHAVVGEILTGHRITEKGSTQRSGHVQMGTDPFEIRNGETGGHFAHACETFVGQHLIHGSRADALGGHKVIKEKTHPDSLGTDQITLSPSSRAKHEEQNDHGKDLLHKEIVWFDLGKNNGYDQHPKINYFTNFHGVGAVFSPPFHPHPCPHAPYSPSSLSGCS